MRKVIVLLVLFLSLLYLRNYYRQNKSLSSVIAQTSSITAPPNCPEKARGDANCDGQINDADKVIWKCEFAGNGDCISPNPISHLKADFDLKGSVDMVDFEIWRKNKFDVVQSTNTPTPTIPNTPTLTPTGAPALNGLNAQYFDNVDFTSLKISRVDPQVNFDWGTGSPDSSIGSDTFSVRWMGQITPKYSQVYTFYTSSDDGIRLAVNGTWIINNWTTHAVTENTATITLVAGTKYDIVLDYYENAGGAVAKLSWSSSSQSKEIIPTSQLTAVNVAIPTLPAATNTPTPTPTPTCAAGYTRCTNGCKNLKNDNYNCGSCAHVCSSNRVCSNGNCVTGGGGKE